MQILFTGYYFNHFSGSQVYICEMAQHLQSKGYSITIVSPNITDNFVESLKNKNILLVNEKNINLDIEYDIIFALHYPIINHLIAKKIKYKKIVNICLSPFAKLESPVNFHKKLDILIANSQETRNKMINTDNVDEQKVVVLPNFLPDEYINYKFEQHKQLKKIVIISNHIPKELKEINNILQDVDIDYIGLEYVQTEITPEFLSSYDAVISIGKTIQYSLGMKIPVYEYDCFGGCGYITLENYETEKAFNFSGRATNRKLCAEEIAHELKANFNKATINSEKLKELAIKDFSYKNIDKIMEKISKIRNSPMIEKKDLYTFKLYQRIKGINNIRHIYILGFRVFSYEK